MLARKLVCELIALNPSLVDITLRKTKAFPMSCGRIIETVATSDK
jgi:hypothetical protein